MTFEGINGGGTTRLQLKYCTKQIMVKTDQAFTNYELHECAPENRETTWSLQQYKGMINNKYLHNVSMAII